MGGSIGTLRQLKRVRRGPRPRLTKFRKNGIIWLARKKEPILFILTEKPSVAKSFGEALGASRGKDGVWEGDGVTVAHCHGHLFELVKPEAYDEKYRRWSFENLPIIPETYIYQPKEGEEKLCSLVVKLLRKHKSDRIIVATDADREGELIAREVFAAAEVVPGSNCRRFWVSTALKPDTVKKGIEDALPWSEYDQLARKGYARQRADWLVGMNMSPFATLLAGGRTTFPVGRVQTAVLAAVAQRNNEVKNFVSEPYLVATASLVDGSGNSAPALLVNPETKKTSFPPESKVPAEAVARAESDGKVAASAETERKSEPAPKLLDLTALQMLAAKRFDYTAAQTLAAAQKLYEEYKCLSYPRTSSCTMGDGDVGLFKKVFDLLKGDFAISKHCDESLISKSNKRVFAPSEAVDGHFALIPLNKLPAKAGEAERNVWNIVAERFFMAVMPPFVYDEKCVRAKNGEYEWQASVKIVVSAGWKACSEKDGDEAVVDSFDERSARLESPKVEKKQTQPKKEFTEASLLAFMKNPVAKGEGKMAGLGTPATRAEIIKKLQTDQYLVKEKKKFYATDKGFFLLSLLFKNPLTAKIAGIRQTTEWEEALENSPEEFERGIEAFVREVAKIKPQVESFAREALGKCPLCGKPVMEGKKSWFCSGWNAEPKCEFSIWKEICGARLTASDAKKLLSGGKTGEKKMKSKAGKAFSAKLFYDTAAQKVTFAFDEKKRRG